MRPPELDVTFLLEHLDCIKAQEGGGDEPYLWAIGFKVDADTITPPTSGVIPTLNVQVVPGTPFFAHVVGAGSTHSGKSYPIAPQLGTRAMRIKPARLDAAGWFPGLAGVICLLWDEDAFSPSTGEAGLARLKQVLGPALSAEFNSLLAGGYDAELAKGPDNGQIPGWQSLANVPWRLARLRDEHGRNHAQKELVKRVKGSISSQIREAFIDAAGLDELIDPDDLLGAEAQVSMGDELLGMVPFQLTFTDDDANYVLRGRSFGQRVRRTVLKCAESVSSRTLQALVWIVQSVCRKPEKAYWALVYQQVPKLRFEVASLAGPDPASVRWVIDGQLITGSDGSLPVSLGPPQVFGVVSDALAVEYPGGPGLLTFRQDGHALELGLSGLGMFSGKVRAVYAFDGDPTLFPATSPASAGEIIDRGYDLGEEFTLTTLDIQMSDEFNADVERCLRESLKKYLVKYVPVGWGERFERPEPPNWQELYQLGELAVRTSVALPPMSEPPATVRPVADPGRRILKPRWHA